MTMLHGDDQIEQDEDEDEYESYTEGDEEEEDLADENDNQNGDDDSDMKDEQQPSDKADETMSCASFSALRFADWEEVVEIDCDYSPDETEAMWFNSDDYASFLEQCEAMAAEMVANQQDGTACPIQLRDLIGLEAWTKEGYKKRQKQRLGSIDVVLDEQFAQWDDGGENPESIAKLYIGASEESKIIASTKALHLERDIQAYLLESMPGSFSSDKSSMSTISLTANSAHDDDSSSNSNKSSAVNPGDSSSTQVTTLEEDEHDSCSDDEEVESNDDQTSDDSTEDINVDVVEAHENDDESMDVEVDNKRLPTITTTRPPKVPAKKSADANWKKIKGAPPVYSKYQQKIVVPSSIRKESKTGPSSSKELNKDSSMSSVASAPKTSPKPSSTKSCTSVSASSESSVSSDTNNSTSRPGSQRSKVAAQKVVVVAAAAKTPEIIDLPTRRAPPKTKSLAGRRKPEALRTVPPPSRITPPVKKIITKKTLVKKHPPKKHAPLSSSLTNKGGSIMAGSSSSLRTSQHPNNSNRSLSASSQHRKHPPGVMKHLPGTATGPVGSSTAGLARKSSLRPGTKSNQSGSNSSSGTATPVVKKKVPKLNTVTVRKPGEGPPEAAKPKSLKFKRSGPLPVMTPVSKSKKSLKDTTDKAKKSTKSSTSTEKSGGGGLVPNFLRRKT
jgi:hypothetical protein